jgi:FMN phosphatase YigB (HAD superfamily)
VAELENLSDQVASEFEEMNTFYAELIQEYPAFAEALAILADLKAHLAELDN